MPLVDADALAQTYAHPSKDPVEAVELYREATAKPENWGSQRVASAINSDQSNEFEGISRSEVRAWVDGDSKPDAARAVDVERDLGWMADEWTDTVRALAELVIGVYAFGSINKRDYSPSWSPDNAANEGRSGMRLTAWASTPSTSRVTTRPKVKRSNLPATGRNLAAHLSSRARLLATRTPTQSADYPTGSTTHLEYCRWILHCCSFGGVEVSIEAKRHGRSKLIDHGSTSPMLHS